MDNIFPSPYTLSDGIKWVNYNLSLSPPLNFVIADPTTSLAIGGIGLKPGTDVHERSVEVGYWLGEELWGRGVATEALVGFVGWVLGEREWERVIRVHAGVYGGNVASGRVLRKAGFRLEGCLRRHVWKEGRLLDLEVYAVLREEWEGRERERAAEEGPSAGEMSI
ncbi:hypothetical protein W97_06099 [Coniosporium apollinis CBS 100218]|uniref:N-acetyltransferase domain-containing protein n=1 Tax=Coniosporium apollinis (strain CBS 100218) TaxID=1168221 RepID=R7YYQ9_CONA1|nr:uncharacterized protein W97_06099 [Coniosporium apollinis CBS 100218]EON66983.1 hypothetical protein W97_06099 [Coniosporium apollinis CBS 100218]